MADAAWDPGIECFECSSIFELDDLGGVMPDDVEKCPSCGSDSIGPVEISECPQAAGLDGNAAILATDECDDDAHHYGRGDHVRTVQR